MTKISLPFEPGQEVFINGFCGLHVVDYITVYGRDEFSIAVITSTGVPVGFFTADELRSAE